MEKNIIILNLCGTTYYKMIVIYTQLHCLCCYNVTEGYFADLLCNDIDQ